MKPGARGPLATFTREGTFEMADFEDLSGWHEEYLFWMSNEEYKAVRQADLQNRIWNPRMKVAHVIRIAQLFLQDDELRRALQVRAEESRKKGDDDLYELTEEEERSAALIREFCQWCIWKLGEPHWTSSTVPAGLAAQVLMGVLPSPDSEEAMAFIRKSYSWCVDV